MSIPTERGFQPCILQNENKTGIKQNTNLFITMARILYWNINNFSLSKIYSSIPALAGPAQQRLNYIVNNIMSGPVGGPPPDIIVVVEVYSRVREVSVEGTVLSPHGGAGQGVRLLLQEIQNAPALNPHGAVWSVVPPLNLGGLGQQEAVAVFYNAAVLQFTGPNLFYQGSTKSGPWGFGQSQPVNAVTFANRFNYPNEWNNVLPPGSVNFPGIGLVPINQLAGEWQYYGNPALRKIPSPFPPDNPPNRVQFPNVGCRGPFYTRFNDIAGRTLNLFAIHTSPSTASRAVLNMQRVPEMQALGLNQVNAIFGDFNVDSFGSTVGVNNWGGVGGAYTWMLPHYTGALNPTNAGAIAPSRKPYCMTHLLPNAYATPFNNVGVGVATDPQHNVYPRYGYMGSSWPEVNDSGAIDNFFTAYGGGTAVGPAAHITVINTITGTPYNVVPPPFGGGVTPELTNGLQYNGLPVSNILLAVPPANAGTGGINSPNALQQTAFRQWPNFQGIYSTSDHLPLMIDV